ncbi:cytochrome P450 [Dendrothele bispora CBS 962.96]|uniref:Cytochrome P450 n=1 Tax=Dendrothele bispora (strain CBS 962.96) TaxID=1314807 RepID=A0A4S8KYE4_DENBC|nr:cytochrome P450 [Dendrothele bispora CBS 962.96]
MTSNTNTNIIYILLGSLSLKKRYSPLPPGPKKLPLIGNLLDFPTSFEWETYARWGKEYNSDIIHLDVAGTSLVILNSLEASMDLLDKRSSIYSSRPRMVMVKELMGWDWVLGMMAYGDEWRAIRRLFNQEFHQTAAARFQPRELKRTHILLRRILDSPDDFLDHIRYLVGSSILEVAYGLKPRSSGDPYIDTAEVALASLAIAATPGAFLVDVIPVLKYVPEWIPGAGFQRKAKEWKTLALGMRDKPFQEATKQISEGTVPYPSFTSYSLDKLDETEDKEEQKRLIQATAATMFAGGTDTTWASISTFVLAMLANPEAQKAAQKELDAYLAPGELPTFKDEPFLPHVSAIVKEVYRWKPVTPLAIPHLNTEEDVYKGYRIPAESLVMPNVWAILYDETKYPSPQTFNPSRFLTPSGQLDPSVQDPEVAMFGFGRRICPGKYMAHSTVWVAVASMLTVFDIRKKVDEKTGEVVEPGFEYVSALGYLPKPFKASLKPRSKYAESLIRSTAQGIDD